MESSACLALVLALLASTCKYTGAQDSRGAASTDRPLNNSTVPTTIPPPTSPTPSQYCEVGHQEGNGQLTESAMNRLFILDAVPSCDGVIKSVSLLVNIPDDQNGIDLSELTVTLVAYHYSTESYHSKLEDSLTMESPKITIAHREEGKVIKATFSPRQEKRLHIEAKLFNIGVLLSGTADMRLEWNLSTRYQSYSVMVENLDQLPPMLPDHTLNYRTPSVWFEIGPDDIPTTNTTVPPTAQPTRPLGDGTSPDEVDNTGLIVGAVTTVVAVTFVLLACLALLITILIKFGRRRKPDQGSARCLQVANGVHGCASASSTIMSRACVLDNNQNKRPSSSLPLTPFQVAINGDRLQWSFGSTAGDGVFTASTIPFADSPPFPMPTYEVQNSLSTVVLKGSETGPMDKTSATMHSRLTEALYDTPSDGKVLTPKGSLYQHKEYDDVADRPYEAPPKKESKIYDYLQRKDLFKLKRDELKIVDYLGSGNFADIHKAVWVKVGQEEMYVATKTLVSKSKKDRLRFLQEAHMMAQFKHVNIVKIHGVLAEKEPAMIVLELMQGDLRKFLQSEACLFAEACPDDLQTMFLRFAREIAAGMKYLSRKGFIHRDLAARNVLMTENLTCKISDFGLARDLSGDGIYQSQGGSIPVKWTAPEALHYGSYTSASDVWSYGIVLFEIWSLGKKPYQGLRNEHVLNFLENGQRLDPPPGVPRAIYSVMIDCWHPQPEDRPCFTKLEEELSVDDKVLLDNSPKGKEDTMASEQVVHLLGGSVVTGQYIYPTLQNKYLYHLDDNISLC